jgi:hypothetical protein
MPIYRFHLDSQVKIVADSNQENPAQLAQAGQRDGFISATITTGEPKSEFLAPTQVAIPFQHIELIEKL